MSRLTVGSIEGLTENSNVISVPTGHSLNVVDDFDAGNGSLHVDSSNSRVGIGTSSPACALHLPVGTTGATDFRVGSTMSVTRVATGNSNDGNTTVNISSAVTGSHSVRSGLLVLTGGNANAYQSFSLYHYNYGRVSAGNSQLTQLARNHYAFDSVVRVQLSLTEAAKNNVNVVIDAWSTGAGYWYLDFIAMGYYS